MKLLILQLSDIHIKSKNDKIFSRKSYISEALRNLTDSVDLCVIAVTGDIAYSGSIEQYEESLELFETLKSEIPLVLNNSKLEFVSIPGNHDCDFNLASRVRSSVMQVVKQDGIVDESIINSATVVQRDFFAIQDVYFNRHLERENKLYWQYKFVHGKSTVIFSCFNTAWLSELREKPGDMFFPIEYMPNPQGVDLVVSLFHHPYNWLMPDNSRAFRKHVESISDIILTGHEHDVTVRTSRIGGLQESTHIEAGALQDSYSNATSEFNCILVDTDEHARAVLPFKWDNNKYRSIYSLESRWEKYQDNSKRLSNEFGLKETTSIWLNDLGLQVKHPSKGPLSREDIFVFPDLVEVGYWQRRVPRIFTSESFYEHISETGKALVTGVGDAGKTVLSKELFSHYYKEGLIPLYFDAGLNKTISTDGMITLFGRECEQTYNNLDAEDYRQLDKSRRVIIIDNFERISFKSGNRSIREVLDFLSRFAGTVILLANDVAIQASEVLVQGLSFATEGESAFKQFRIQPFGHLLRENLVEQWFSFDSHLSGDSDLYKKIHEVTSLIDTVIGNNFLPPYPVILLPLLQAYQYHDQVNTNASTYGYFYELLILRSLTERTARVTIDVKKGYLTFLAKYLFMAAKFRLTESETLVFHQAYEEKFDIRVSYRDIINALTENSILEQDGSDIYFKYDYIYYYFIASSLRDEISDLETREIISRLSKTLHEDSSANILLFLTHLTKDPFIVGQMISAAAVVFPNTKRATLSRGMNILSGNEEEGVNTFQDEDVRTSRRERKRFLDSKANMAEEAEGGEESNESTSQGVANENLALTEEQEKYMASIGVAMKTLQILGQLLKNYVGTMDKITKNQLVNECVGIGLRTLGSVLDSFEPNKEFFIQTMTEIFQDEDASLTYQAAKNKAVQSIFGMVHNNSYGAIRRISNAIGSPLLTQVYDRLLEKDDTPAIRLIHTALYFDNTPSFPLSVLIDAYEQVKDNPLGLAVLKSFTFNQFYTFDIPAKLKQTACSTLKVRYSPLVGGNPNIKLLRKKN